MTKSLILASLIAMGLGSGAAMARDVDAENLFTGLSQVSLHSLQRDQVIAPTQVLLPVRGQALVISFDGSDGDAGR